MASEKARNGGKREELLSAIRTKMNTGTGARLKPAEAVMILEWAVECDDDRCTAELLRIFGVMGGVQLLREAFGILP